MATYTPRSLEPTQVALPMALSRGALIALPNPEADATKKKQSAYQVLRFQYNPGQSRARTGQFERKLDKEKRRQHRSRPSRVPRAAARSSPRAR